MAVSVFVYLMNVFEALIKMNSKNVCIACNHCLRRQKTVTNMERARRGFEITL